MDMIYVAQRRQQEEIDQALASRKAPGVGREVCANMDCREPIAAFRQQMGATLCIDCKRDEEREAQRCARSAV